MTDSSSQPRRPSWTLLFTDVRFRTFVTPSIIAALYVLALVLGAVIPLLTIFKGSGSGLTLLTIPASIVAYLLFVAVLRVSLEVVMVLFRISEQLEDR